MVAITVGKVGAGCFLILEGPACEELREEELRCGGRETWNHYLRVSLGNS